MKLKFRITHVLSVLCIVLISEVSCAQRLNKEDLLFLIKLTLFEESVGSKDYVANHKSLKTFLQLAFQVDTLETIGFFDYTFLRIGPEYESPGHIFINDGPFLLDNCDGYVVAVYRRAVSNRSIFKIKGFTQNDFPFLLKNMERLGYESLSSRKQFVNGYFVESLDLKCLYAAAKRFSLDYNKYPCLKDCSGL